MTSSPAAPVTFRDALNDALRYWEPRRLIYNGVLVAIVLLCWPQCFRLAGSFVVAPFVVLFVLAMIANILYCAAHVVDVVIQLSDFRETWRNWRWVLFFLGTLLASVMALATLFPMALPDQN